jgi:hypothetical protein
MRVVVLHESPGADDLAGEIGEAAAAFNRGLDIRLRFLDVGFEIHTVPVPDDAATPLAPLSEAIEKFRPGAVLVLGRGRRLLECAAAAAKSGPPLVYLVNGERDRTVSALTHLAEVFVVPAGEEAGGGDRAQRLPEGEAPGRGLIEIMLRNVREKR